MNSGSLYFPFTEDVQKASLLRAYTVNDVLVSAMKCYLLTSPGQRRGNMIGSFLPSLRHQLIQDVTLVSLQNQLKKDLIVQFPGVVFNQVLLIKNLDSSNVGTTSDLIVNIQFGTSISEITELTMAV